MKRLSAPLMVCLLTAAFLAALMLDPRDTMVDTLAKGAGMLAMLLLALSVATDARRSSGASD